MNRAAGEGSGEFNMTVGRRQVEESIREIVKEKLFAGADAESSGGGEIAGLDSIGRLTLLVELENIYQVELMDGGLDEEELRSVEKLAGALLRRLEGGGT